jgi:WD40 repeat protein
MTIDLTAGIVRILNSEGLTSGTGFVVSDEGLIATCSHVVQSEDSQQRGDPRPDHVDVIFHATGDCRRAIVEPGWWRAHDVEDVAILRLEGILPEDATPLPLGSSQHSKGHPFSSRGYRLAEYFPEGLEAEGKIQGYTSYRDQPVLQLLTNQIDQGMSGAPIWDVKSRRVVGMVNFFWKTVRHVDAWLAFATPTETLRQVCSDLRLSDLCPYRGLAAFTEADAEFFFGREALVADLITHLRGNPRFLAVVGPSGSGKSSVVRAGLFPALRRGDLPGSENWHMVSFRPGADPFAALAAAGLETGPEAELRAAVRAFLDHYAEIGRLTLFADQFEELFALCPEPVQDKFMRELLALLENDLPVTLILTLRADFYGYLLGYAPLVEWLKLGQVNVPPMGPEELQAVIRKPAEEVGLRFEPGLVQLVAEETGQVEHSLPLLESALTQLWGWREEGALTHNAYQGIGQVTGAIGLWAEDAYSRLSGEERRLTQHVFTRLVHFGDGETADTRQRCTLAELVIHPEQLEGVHRLVQHLADARLLVTDRHPTTGEETAEVIHDALLREWGRLRRWLTEQREFYLWRQRLDERLHEWEGKVRDEGLLLRSTSLIEAERWLSEGSDDLNPSEQYYIQASIQQRDQETAERERQRRRIIYAIGAIALLIIVALGVGLWSARRIAESERVLAQQQRDAAEIAAALASEAQMAVTAEVMARQTAQAEAEFRATAVAIASTREAEANTAATAEALARQTAIAGKAEAQTAAIAEAEARQTAEARRAEVEEQRDELGRQRQIAVARQLAAQAQLALDNTATGLVQSVLLAVESLRRLPSFESDQALRQGLSILNQPTAEIKQGDWASSIAFSPDGRWLATASWRSKIARVWEIATTNEVTQVTHEDGVNAVAFSPDGRLLATAGRDGRAKVWDIASNRQVAEITHQEMVWSVDFSPDGRWLAMASGEVPSLGQQTGVGEVRVWDRVSEREVVKASHDGQAWCVLFSPDGKWLAMTSRNGVARIWETATWREVARLVHPGEIASTAFSPDSKRLATASSYGTARIWEVATGNILVELDHGSAKSVWGLAFSPDGRLLATASQDNTARIWNATTGQQIAQLAHGHAVSSVEFSPDGKWLATYGDVTVRVWEVATEREVARMPHEGYVYEIAFSPDSHWLATATRETDGPVRIWPVTVGEEMVRLEHNGRVSTIAVSPDGHQLATGSEDGSVVIWDIDSGQEVKRMMHEDWVVGMTFSPDGKQLATASYDNTARVWDVATGQQISEVQHSGNVLDVAFSPDGKWLATASHDNTARIWNAMTGEQKLELPHQLKVNTVAFSPNGRFLVTGSGGPFAGSGEIGTWDPDTGKEIDGMICHGIVTSVAFSPNGQRLAVNIEGSLWILDATVKHKVYQIIEHAGGGWGHGVAFSPDGRWVATANPGANAQIWEVNTGQKILQMKHDGSVTEVAFSPSGRWLMTASDDGTARVWLLLPEDLIAEACSRLQRNLTREEWSRYLAGEPYRPTCPNLPVPEE